MSDVREAVRLRRKRDQIGSNLGTGQPARTLTKIRQRLQPHCVMRPTKVFVLLIYPSHSLRAFLTAALMASSLSASAIAVFAARHSLASATSSSEGFVSLS